MTATEVAVGTLITPIDLNKWNRFNGLAAISFGLLVHRLIGWITNATPRPRVAFFTVDPTWFIYLVLFIYLVVRHFFSLGVHSTFFCVSLLLLAAWRCPVFWDASSTLPRNRCEIGSQWNIGSSSVDVRCCSLLLVTSRIAVCRFVNAIMLIGTDFELEGHRSSSPSDEFSLRWDWTRVLKWSVKRSLWAFQVAAPWRYFAIHLLIENQYFKSIINVENQCLVIDGDSKYGLEGRNSRSEAARKWSLEYGCECGWQRNTTIITLAQISIRKMIKYDGYENLYFLVLLSGGGGKKKSSTVTVRHLFDFK